MHNSQIKSGIKWTSVSTMLISLLQILQLVILTKLLNPSDFGLYAMVTVVVGFTQSFLDMGFTQSIIQKQIISNIEITTIYWLNILVGFFLYLIILTISPFITEFYNEPSLYEYILISSLSLLILPFGQVFMAFKQKEMKFEYLAKLSIFTKFIGFCTTIILAFYELGILSLIYGILISYILQIAILIFNGYKNIKIYFKFNLNSVSDHITFGKNLTLTKILNYFYLQIDTILIGKFFGMETLGIYNVAKQLVLKPSQIINYTAEKVFFPAMSKVQDDNNSIKNMYLTLTKYITLINFYIFSIFIIFANEIIKLMYGDKWLDAAPILALLAIYNAFRGITINSNTILLAKAKTTLYFKWNLFMFIYMLVLMFFSSQYSIIEVSYALIFFSITLIIPNWYFLLRTTIELKFNEYINNIFKPFFIIFICFILTYLLYTLLDKNLYVYIFIIMLNISIFLILIYLFEKNILATIIKFLRKSS